MNTELHKNSALIGFVAPVLFGDGTTGAQPNNGPQIVIRNEPFGSAKILATVDAISENQTIASNK